MDELLTVDEVAKWLRLKPKTVYAMASGKKIPHSKIGGALRFNRKVLEVWMNQNSVKVTV